MTSRSRSCKNHPDSFCYICNELKITDGKKFTQKTYRTYFGVQLGDHDKPWALHVVF